MKKMMFQQLPEGAGTDESVRKILIPRALSPIPADVAVRAPRGLGSGRGVTMRAAAMLPALLLAGFLFAGCGKHEPAASSPSTPPLPTAAVKVAKVEAGAAIATEEITGTVRPKLRAVIEAKMNGRIERMAAVPGQRVKAGDLLAELDAREIRARLDQALAARQQAAGDLKRFTSLLAQQAVTQAEFDAVQARERIAQAAASEAETLLGHARIAAPFDGVIVRKLADVGDLAAPGRALIEIEDPASLRVEAGVPEAIIDRLRDGASLPVRGSGAGKVSEAVLSEISPVADEASRTFLVKLDLPADAGWRVGQFVRVLVPVGESTALEVPRSAVIERGQMELVFVVADKAARLRVVKTGRAADGKVALISGVSAGESVVTEGAASLRDGQPVEVKP